MSFTKSEGINPIIVVGTGRCGSSAMANILRILGVHMGERFAPADSANPNGFWEDLDFKEIHMAYLENEIVYREFCEALKSLKHYRDQHHVRWGFKDPRAAQVIPIYQKELFPNARYIWMQRNPIDTQWSMFKNYVGRHNMPITPHSVFQTWMVRQAMIEMWMPYDVRRCLRLQFEILMAQPWDVVRCVAYFIYGRDVDEAKIEEATATIQRRSGNVLEPRTTQEYADHREARHGQRSCVQAPTVLPDSYP